MADRPWLMRTYSGHTRPPERLERALPDQPRQGADRASRSPSTCPPRPATTPTTPWPCRRGGQGRRAHPPHRATWPTLFERIPLEQMNTSMTINATAPWLLSLYMSRLRREAGRPTRRQLRGTTQNDIIKEYLSRGTYAFPPEPSMRLTSDVVAYTVNHVPKWNPINVCSYHLQEAGATPVQEIAFALANAIAVLDAVQASGRRPEPRPDPRGLRAHLVLLQRRGSASSKRCARCRAMTALWEQIGPQSATASTDPKMRRFRYGVQVNSPGAHRAAQPENNIVRIAARDALGVTLSKNARARAIQLPAWNEALGLPRPWDQQLAAAHPADPRLRNGPSGVR